jgi:hypothetical protein
VKGAACRLTLAALAAMPLCLTGQTPSFTLSSSPTSGATTTLSLTVSDSNGYDEDSTVQILTGWGGGNADSCSVIYNIYSNALYLMDDTGSIMLGGVAPGSSPSQQLTNSQCTIDVPQTTASVVGNSVTLHVAITFDSSFVGTLGITPVVLDTTGNLSSGTTASYVAFAANSAPPTIVSLPIPGPGYGTSLSGLTLQVSDPNGAKYIRYADITFCCDSTPAVSYMAYYQAGNDSIAAFDSTAAQMSGGPSSFSVSRSGNTLTIAANNIQFYGFMDSTPAPVGPIGPGGWSPIPGGAADAGNNSVTGGGGSWWIGNVEITAPANMSQYAMSGAGSGTINAMASAATQWTATSQASWIHIVSGASGTGSGSVGYTYDANQTGSPRFGCIFVDDLNSIANYAGEFGYCVAVNQDNVLFTPTSFNFNASGGTGTVNVTAPAGAWNGPTDVDSWVHITSSTGAGNGAFSFSVDANTTGATRTSSIAFGNGGAVAITETATPPTPTISGAPTSPLNPGSQFSVSASQAATWSVSPSSAGSFSPSSSSANQNVTFTVANPIPNSPLTATITATASGGAGTATINLLPPVSITPSSIGSLAAGATQQLSANIPVNWTVSPSNGGTFGLTATNAGQQTTFTMGSAGTANVTVTATDQRYSINSSWVTIGDPPTVTPGSTPSTPLSPGGSLTISANEAVTWSVVPASAGRFGSSSSGANVNDTFTAANPIPNSALTATLTATGAGGSTAQLVVNLAPTIVITPTNPTGLASGSTAPFSANIPVNWTVPTTNGGSVSPTATTAGQATTFTKGTASGSVMLIATDQRYSTNSGSVTIPPETVATAASVSPNGQQGSEQTFTFTFSDTGGASTLTTVSALVATGTSSMTYSCEVTYNAAQNSLALLTDGGAPPNSTITPGSGTAQNSQCILTGSGSTVTTSGNVLTLNLLLGFTQAYIGNKNLYGAAQDLTGSSSGWQNLGTYYIVGVPTMYFDPDDPATDQTQTIPPGTTLTPAIFAFWDGNDNANMQLMEISFGAPATGSGPGPAGGCAVLYNMNTSTFYLADNNGNWQSGTGTLTNSQCSLNVASSTAATDENNYPYQFWVTPSVQFNSSYLGFYPIYAMAQDQAGQSSGWNEMGTVTVNYANSVSIDNVTVNNAGSNITLTAGQTATVQVNLTGEAPSGGAVVQLIATNPSVLSFPSTLTIPAGSTGGQVTVTALQPASGPVGIYVEASYTQVAGAPSPLILVEGVNYPVTTLVTNPPGLTVTVDGVNQTTPYNIVWTSTSGHTITVPGGAQSGGAGTRYGWSSWSDGGALSHAISEPSSNNTITATFATQYYLTTAVSPAGAGTITPSTGWQTLTTQSVGISATPTPNSGYQFSSFSCTPSCSVSGVNGGAGSLAMTGPETVTANFTGSSTTLSIASVTISPSPLVSGGSATVTVSMNQNFGTAVSVGLGVSGSGSSAFDQMPLTVTIPANQSSGSASFTVGTVTGLNSVTATVRASYGSNSDTLSGTFTVAPTAGSTNAVSREYIRLGGRVIAIENPPAPVAAPVMSPAPGAYAVGQTITLTAAAGSTIYYTTNGSTPSPTNGTQYSSSSPIQVTATVPIMAVAVVSGVTSAAAIGTYTIDAAGLGPDFLRWETPWQPRRAAIAAASEKLPVDFLELYRSQAILSRREASAE